MSSPVKWDNNEPAGNATSTEIESAFAAQSPALARTSLATQRVVPPPAVRDTDAEPDDLVARALAVLEREQERWRVSRSESSSGSRS
jgi:hypothetical protein